MHYKKKVRSPSLYEGGGIYFRKSEKTWAIKTKPKLSLQLKMLEAKCRKYILCDLDKLTNRNLTYNTENVYTAHYKQSLQGGK